jgi:hypothetical protein
MAGWLALGTAAWPPALESMRRSLSSHQLIFSSSRFEGIVSDTAVPLGGFLK